MPESQLDLPANKEEAVAQSINTPSVIAAKYVADAAKDDIDVAFSELLPTVSIEGSWVRSEETEFAGAVAGRRTGDHQGVAGASPRQAHRMPASDSRSSSISKAGASDRWR